jgi:acetylornithine/LysW-gamma-L-lysine aminotransferase
MSASELIQQLEEAHASGAYRPAPTVLIRGRGARAWDAEGNEYLDCATGVGVALLGHGHPALVRAIREQAETLLTCAAGYHYNDVRARFLAKFVGVLPPGLTRVFLSNSGTEAIEAAIKLARAVTGHPKIVAAMRGFHGRTLGALSATWKADYKKPFEPLVPSFVHVPFGDPDALAQAVDEETAAVLLEPIQGEAGVYPAPPGYLQAAREICDERGTLLIFDEIQSGLRTGRWLACEHDGVVPDVVCLGKGLAGGVPIGATAFREGLQFQRGQHGSTFGGNPLACRAALVVIETIEREGLLQRSARVGARFLQGLQELVREFPQTAREARGRGLMLALQLRGKAAPVLEALRRRGVLALSGGGTALRFLPPLVFAHEDVDQVLGALREALSTLSSRSDAEARSR